MRAITLRSSDLDKSLTQPTRVGAGSFFMKFIVTFLALCLCLRDICLFKSPGVLSLFPANVSFIHADSLSLGHWARGGEDNAARPTTVILPLICSRRTHHETSSPPWKIQSAHLIRSNYMQFGIKRREDGVYCVCLLQKERRAKKVIAPDIARWLVSLPDGAPPPIPKCSERGWKR